MARSLKKGPYVQDSLQAKVYKARESQGSARDQDLVAAVHHHSGIHRLTLAVHNGRKFIPVYVTENMVGHKFRRVFPPPGNSVATPGTAKPRWVRSSHGNQASAKYLHISPTKLRLVARTLPGKKVDDALAMLQFMPPAGARLVRKVVMSAVANAEQRPQIDVDTLVIKVVQVDGGPSLKRFQARAMGRVNRIPQSEQPYNRVLKKDPANDSNRGQWPGPWPDLGCQRFYGSAGFKTVN